MAKTKEKKFFEILKKNADKDGIIKNPVNFWEEAGCINLKSARNALSRLKIRGEIKIVKKGVWQLTKYKKKQKEDVGEKIISTTATDELFLTPQEKTAFEWLGNLKTEADQKPTERFGEQDLKFEDENEKEEFIKKMTSKNILRDTLKNGTRGKIYELKTENWLFWSEKIKIDPLPIVKERLKKLETQIKAFEKLEKEISEQESEKNKVEEKIKELERELEKLKREQSTLAKGIVHRKYQMKKDAPPEIEKMKWTRDLLKKIVSSPPEYLEYYLKFLE